MKFELHDINGNRLIEFVSDKILINNVQDALDLMADSTYHGSNRLIIHESNILPDFFNLKTGFAGEILQKFSTYNVNLAIIGDFSKYPSKSLQDFIFESNKLGRINFVNSLTLAKEKLTK